MSNSRRKFGIVEVLERFYLGKWATIVFQGDNDSENVASVDANNVLQMPIAASFPQGGIKADDIAISQLVWVDVAATAALLDGAGSVTVMAGVTGDQYKVREIILVGGGTNFGAGGNRTIVLTDGTTTWTTIANADIEAAPAASLRWGDTKVPFATGTSNTKSASGADIVLEYAGGTTDHTTGSITFSICLEKTN